MSAGLHVRNVIVGAGAIGSAAAYHLARRGEPLLLVEQFGLGHARGSSHGAARIARHSYADPRYAALMPEAFRAWRELEADAGRSLYLRTGGVSFGPPEVDYVDRVAASLRTIGVPHRRMTGRELNRRSPAFAVPATYDVAFEPDAGVLAAERAVAAMIELIRLECGEASVLVDTPVRRIDLDADRPTLVTDTLNITADRLIVAAGAWIGKLLPHLAATLRPTRQQVFYFDPADRPDLQIGSLPVFIFVGAGEGDVFYGMPPCGGMGVKVARHGGPGVDPDAVEPGVSEEARLATRSFVDRHLPSLADAPIQRAEVCLYTMAPGDDFVVGPLPGRPDVIVASPCSGHGFKFAPLVGRALADLAMNGTTDLDIGAWSKPDGFVAP